MGFSPPPSQTLTHPEFQFLPPRDTLSHGTQLPAVARASCACSSWLCSFGQSSPLPSPGNLPTQPLQGTHTEPPPRSSCCFPDTGGLVQTELPGKLDPVCPSSRRTPSQVLLQALKGSPEIVTSSLFDSHLLCNLSHFLSEPQFPWW